MENLQNENGLALSKMKFQPVLCQWEKDSSIESAVQDYDSVTFAVNT